MKIRPPQQPRIFEYDSQCPYFEDGRISTSEYIIPAPGQTEKYHELLARGYRRAGHVFYRNVCKDCSACKPLRLETGSFIMSAGQKRTLRNNKDVRIEIRPSPSLSTEKVMLYEEYLSRKHANGIDGKGGDPFSALFTLHAGYDHIIEMNYYIGGKLIAVGIVDEAEDALSSNYFYYDTGYLDRRPGVFSVLQEISLAGSMGKKYYYLGFYIEENRKMSYKKHFRPNRVYVNGEWIEFLKDR
ncbi:MAG: arginyltransferase [Nitrospirae bacterium]|nr:arginyltransferase [Nitrospirota bacterium]